MDIVIIMPVYEDWDAAIQLCRNIDAVLRQEGSLRASLLFIDDGSTLTTYERGLPFQPEAIDRVAVLRLRRNLGHQRAIAVALAHIQSHWTGDAVVVMDADGEDRPEDIPVLLGAMRNAGRPTAVFAERGRRLESLSFRLMYRCYSLLHRVFTGRDIRFGNFSVLPWSYLDSLVVCPELWNHYSATFLKSRLPYIRVRCDRGRRLAGESRMNFVSLVTHGMSALFANQEVVGTRLLLTTVLTAGCFFLLIGAIVGVKLFTHLTIPGWVAITIGLSFLLLGEFLVGCFILVFSVMMTRSHLGFLPTRDYAYFVAQETTLYSVARSTQSATMSAASGSST
ncbi:MAG: glycosyltransferase [Acidobacteriia bacterium]|nr:glycosyltransferase [Terriglobia bacterium]